MEVTGNPAEVMLLYCMWQSKLWQGWETYLVSTSDGEDHLSKQTTQVVTDIKDGQPLLLEDGTGQFEEAFNFAELGIKQLGLSIKTDRIC